MELFVHVFHRATPVDDEVALAPGLSRGDEVAGALGRHVRQVALLDLGFGSIEPSRSHCDVGEEVDLVVGIREDDMPRIASFADHVATDCFGVGAELVVDVLTQGLMS